jgi:hypothetical protein
LDFVLYRAKPAQPVLVDLREQLAQPDYLEQQVSREPPEQVVELDKPVYPVSLGQQDQPELMEQLDKLV